MARRIEPDASFNPAVTSSYFPSCSATLDPDRYNSEADDTSLRDQIAHDDPAGRVGSDER